MTKLMRLAAGFALFAPIAYALLWLSAQIVAA